ncbi:MAG: chaperonin GroEL [Methylomonas sp.]|nr:chaperonin GroEL [Methylomonas sp.]
MSKHIIYNPEARQRLLQGMDTVARAAAVTLGGNGPAVLIQHRTDGIAPVFTRDGVTVANAIILEDRIADLGGRMLRDVAGTVSRQVGDGTTTAIVLARALAAACLKSVAAGFHPLELKKGLELGLTLVEQHLQKHAVVGVTSDWIEHIAAVACKNETGVGELLAQALSELGHEGAMSFQLGNGREDRLDIVEGIQYDQGYLSPYFVTDKTNNQCVLERPYILLYDREITDMLDLVPILEQVSEERRPLLIIAESIQDQALAPLLLNHIRGVFQVAAIKPPGFGDKRLDRLQDLALLTGGEAILAARSQNLERVDLAQLGQAQRVVISAEQTTIVGAAGDAGAITLHRQNLGKEADAVRERKPGQGSPTGNRHELEELEERMAMLAGKVGQFQVGGITDVEIKERLVRIENAYRSAQAALQEGVMPGGGVGLYNARGVLAGVIAANAEQQQGVAILQQAMAAPLLQVLNNAGVNADAVIARLAEGGSSQAYDTLRQRHGDFIDIGIIDPVKVARLALRSAVSTIATLMGTESVVMDVPDPSIMAGYSPEWAAATREDPRI